MGQEQGSGFNLADELKKYENAKQQEATDRERWVAVLCTDLFHEIRLMARDNHIKWEDIEANPRQLQPIGITLTSAGQTVTVKFAVDSVTVEPARLLLIVKKVKAQQPDAYRLFVASPSGESPQQLPYPIRSSPNPDLLHRLIFSLLTGQTQLGLESQPTCEQPSMPHP